MTNLYPNSDITANKSTPNMTEKQSIVTDCKMCVIDIEQREAVKPVVILNEGTASIIKQVLMVC